MVWAGVFRGKVWHNSDPLQWCLIIITRIVQLQTLASPLRHHIELDDDDDRPAIEETAAAIRAAREVIDGMHIGRAIDVRAVDGEVRGPRLNENDTEPEDKHIDTGRELKDFSSG